MTDERCLESIVPWLCAPTFGHDIAFGSDSPDSAHQDIPPVPDSEPHIGLESNQYNYHLTSLTHQCMTVITISIWMYMNILKSGHDPDQYGIKTSICTKYGLALMKNQPVTHSTATVITGSVCRFPHRTAKPWQYSLGTILWPTAPNDAVF